MLGGFVAFVISAYLKLPPAVTLVLTAVIMFMIGAGVLGLMIPAKLRITTKPDDQNYVMIMMLAFATFAEYLILELFGGGAVAAPSILNGATLIVSNVYLTNQVILAAGISLSAYLILFIFLKFTKTGKGIRAFTQNGEVARSIGIDGQKLAFIVYGIGVMMAAVSGALLASIYSVDSATGWNELVIAFVIVTFGGIGSVSGSLIGGLIYGIVYSIMLYYYPTYALVAVLVMIYALLVIKPTGLRGKIVERV